MIFDLHNDFPTALPSSEFARYIERAAATVTAAIWTSELSDPRGFIGTIMPTLENSGMPIALEDIGFLCGSDIEGFDFSRFLYCSLTWNNKNGFAGGASDDGRLTEEGKNVIERMNGVCAVDLAHIGKSAFYAALDAAQRPMCSHTGFADSGNPRCLDDSQISALVARHAPIGLCAVRRFTGADTAVEFAKVIDSFAERYGVDCLCLGTDFCGSDDLPPDLSKYSHFSAVSAELSRLGYGESDIDKIFYSNAKRFYEEIHNERHL